MRANIKNLRLRKEELMRAWRITPWQWDRFRKLALESSWRDYFTRGTHPSFARRDYLQEINDVLEGHGVESLSPDIIDCDYVNMGDTYNVTVILHGDKLFISSWGDYIEKYPNIKGDVAE